MENIKNNSTNLANKAARKTKVVDGNTVTVTPQGAKFLVTEINADGGKWKAGIEDKDPLADDKTGEQTKTENK